jgi:hypothetical protein
MKNLLVGTVVILSAFSAFSQGTVVFSLRSSGTSHVYAPLNGSDTVSIVGQATNDGVPSGTTSYGGRALIGANGLTGPYGAQTTLTSILGGPAGAAESSLIPGALGTAIGGGTATTFRTGVAAGANAAAFATFNNIALDANTAVFEVVAWDNSSGLYSTWALGSTAWLVGLIAAGKSGLFTLHEIGGNLNGPPPLYPTSTSSDTVAMQSFNLWWTPEPSTASLAGLGIGLCLWARRRLGA